RGIQSPFRRLFRRSGFLRPRLLWPPSDRAVDIAPHEACPEGRRGRHPFSRATHGRGGELLTSILAPCRDTSFACPCRPRLECRVRGGSEHPTVNAKANNSRGDSAGRKKLRSEFTWAKSFSRTRSA